MIRHSTLALPLAIALLAGCRPSASPADPSPSPSPASTATAEPASGPPEAAAAPAEPEPKGPIPVPITKAVALGGAEPTPLSLNEPVSIDPAVQFQVEVAVSLVDARLALLDANDALVAGDEAHEIGASWSRYTVVPDAPLRPGSTYRLRLDGATQREARDGEGRAYQVAVWELRTTGEPPLPAKPASKRKRRQ